MKYDILVNGERVHERSASDHRDAVQGWLNHNGYASVDEAAKALAVGPDEIDVHAQEPEMCLGCGRPLTDEPVRAKAHAVHQTQSQA